MQAHHYLGSLAKIGENLWYVATILGEWVALLSFSSAALKCTARDRWIGWNFRHQYSRLNLLTNNSRFLILPEWHYPNLASKTLSLCLKPVSYTHLRAHETVLDLVCRLLLEKKKKTTQTTT